MEYKKQISNSSGIPELFEIAKKITKEYLDADQPGLLVGITDLGSFGNGFIGAFYSLNSNMIIINRSPLDRIKQTKPILYNQYLFHVILHEYIHSLGFYDETQTRKLVLEISLHFFGEKDVLTQLATNMEKFIPNLTYPGSEYIPPKDINIEFVNGIDRRNTNYIN